MAIGLYKRKMIKLDSKNPRNPGACKKKSFEKYKYKKKERMQKIKLI
jgi:hypothetical protein